MCTPPPPGPWGPLSVRDERLPETWTAKTETVKCDVTH